MNEIRRKQIYERLSVMSIKIESRAIPDPNYINSRIGQCHTFLEEVEHFIIEISQELSTYQQAFNNAQSEYENKKEELLSSDREDIKPLPSIRDREAKVNSLLIKERVAIRDYGNELIGLNALQKVINLKNKNLNNANKAIYSQLRVMEAQLKLGSSNPSDPAVKNLMEEIKKSLGNKDIFEEAVPTVSEQKVVDPTTPLNIEEILNQEIEPWVFPNVPCNVQSDSPASDLSIPIIELEEEQSDDELENIPDEDPVEDLLINIEEVSVEKIEPVIDLDQVIDFRKEEKGGAIAIAKMIETKTEEKVEMGNQNEPQKIAGTSYNLDDLLDSILQTH